LIEEDKKDSYDELPYRSVPHPDSHPTHLAVVARLLGIPAPDPYRCRVLELGCAAGGNLIPIAWYLPDTECVGVERAVRQAEAGNRLIEDVGLSNCRILVADLQAVGAELGRFDYIVAHGVFSWVPDTVRAGILRLCRELLAPNGVAFLSFNTLPGWRLRGALREMLLTHCAGVAGAAARLERARELLRFLATAQTEATDPAAAYIRQEVNYLLGAHPSYLYHEYLAETNEALLFRDFAALARAHGLQYLADATLATMFPSTLGPVAERALAPIDDQLELEQAIDFVRLRNFRRALLCHAEVAVDREVSLADVRALAFCADLPALPALVLDREQAQELPLAGGARARVGHPLVKAALGCLAERFPASVDFSVLAAEAGARVVAAGGREFADQRESLAAELFSLFAAGAVRAEPVARDPRPGPADRPRLDRLGLALALEGHLATPRHQAIDLDAFGVHCARLLTGERTPTAVAAALEAAVGRGDVAGLPASPPRMVQSNVNRLLTLFRRHGVLAG
jgi:SAM-dependent methyltransferase